MAVTAVLLFLVIVAYMSKSKKVPTPYPMAISMRPLAKTTPTTPTS
jgi:hypothetical protein